MHYLRLLNFKSKSSIFKQNKQKETVQQEVRLCCTHKGTQTENRKQSSPETA